LRLALLQINPTAGDLDGNSSLIVRAARTAQAQGADLMVTSELALMGYLPRDLLMNQGFVRRAGEKLSHIASDAF
jgi:predicted amidohydrolase